MGFPLIMYLSRAKTVAIWPELGMHGDSYSLRDIKSSLDLSFNPKVDLAAEWKKTDAPPPPSRNESTHWPPWESHALVAAIERVLRKGKHIGGTEDFLRGDFGYPCYKLSGHLTFEDSPEEAIGFGRIRLNSHCLSGKLRLAQGTAVVSLILSLESIAGIDWRDGEWHVWESGAMFMLKAARSQRGFPVFGLFTYEGPDPSAFASCGIVYFASAKVYRHAAERRPDKDVQQLAKGIDTWPEMSDRPGG
jgi:hypothetical protein